MTLNIKVDPDWYKIDDFKLYTTDTLKLEEGVTVLVGCNGVGKTTLISQIKAYAENLDNNIVVEYSEVHQGRSTALSNLGLSGDFAGLASNLTSSEGQNVMHNLGRWASTLRSKFRKGKTENCENAFILADGIDSGLSIDMLITLKGLFTTIAKDIQNMGMHPFIVLATNSFEMISEESHCIYLPDLSPVVIDTYDKFKQAILLSANDMNTLQ